MSFRDAKTYRAKHAREISCIKRSLHTLLDNAVIDHVLERPKPGHVSLRFFDRGVEFLQLLAHGGFLAVHCNVVWSKSVHQLMAKNVRKKGIEGECGLL